MTVPDRITVKITQGTNPYGNGDEYQFSVFKSSASGGKKKDIGAGARLTCLTDLRGCF